MKRINLRSSVRGDLADEGQPSVDDLIRAVLRLLCPQRAALSEPLPDCLQGARLSFPSLRRFLAANVAERPLGKRRFRINCGLAVATHRVGSVTLCAAQLRSAPAGFTLAVTIEVQDSIFDSVLSRSRLACAEELPAS